VISKWILDRVQRRREERAQQAAASGLAPPPQRGRGGRRKAPTPEELTEQLETLRGLAFTVLYDLCCWMANARQPVPDDTDGYSLTPLRSIPDPRERLQYYVNPMLLASWDTALQPFFARGCRLSPELGDSATLTEEGLDRGGPVRVELQFTNRSSVVADGRPRKQLPRGDWVLTLWVSAELNRIDDAILRPLEPASTSS
jgi:hypothetical protein